MKKIGIGKFDQSASYLQPTDTVIVEITAAELQQLTGVTDHYQNSDAKAFFKSVAGTELSINKVFADAVSILAAWKDLATDLSRAVAAVARLKRGTAVEMPKPETKDPKK